MEHALKMVAYLLAKMITLQTGGCVEDLLREASNATATKTDDIDEGSVERIYKAYPTKCPVRGASTGKCDKNRAQIRRLLKDHSETDLLYTIHRYVKECTEGQIFIKNFSTFLNNLPDYDGEELFTQQPKKLLDYDSFVAKMVAEEKR